jgi:peroxiredoxin family protein/TusA-related sulfurtransferase
MPRDTGDQPPSAQAPPVQIVNTLDCRWMQCPGPILRLKDEVETLKDGQAIAMLVDDPGFPADVVAWCHSTGCKLLKLEREGQAFKATVARQSASAAATTAPASLEQLKRNKTIVVFSNDLDRAMGAFIIANGAAAMGSKVTMFFTFWGLNILRKAGGVKVSKGLIERMFGWMMPRGAGRLSLSKLNMAGLGRRMMLGVMKRKGVASLPELMATAQKLGVKLIACSMSMGVMGIKREELIEGVEEAGVAAYLDAAEAGNVNLFI